MKRDDVNVMPIPFTKKLVGKNLCAIVNKLWRLPGIKEGSGFSCHFSDIGIDFVFRYKIASDKK